MRRSRLSAGPWQTGGGGGVGRRLARRSWGAVEGVWGLRPRLGVTEVPGWAASTLRAAFASGVVSALCPLTSRCRVAWFTERSLGCKHGTTLLLPRSGSHSWKVYIYRYNFVLKVSAQILVVCNSHLPPSPSG